MLLDRAKQDDSDTVQEVVADLDRYSAEIDELEFRRMFSGEMDPNNAVLEIQSGSGAPKRRIGRRCCCACTALG